VPDASREAHERGLQRHLASGEARFLGRLAPADEALVSDAAGV
jgi:hypothetical protein